MKRKNGFIFCPIGGATFCKFVKHKGITSLPDSIIVYDKKNQKIFFKGRAVIYILNSLGSVWRGASYLLRSMPLWLVDRSYDFVAKKRRKFLNKNRTSCSLPPPEFRKFFQE
jgi:predicted DCC family thiol-disulfide oxidoreductase YuxK